MGHTHMPFDRLVGGRRAVNPGSVGMSYGRARCLLGLARTGHHVAVHGVRRAAGRRADPVRWAPRRGRLGGRVRPGAARRRGGAGGVHRPGRPIAMQPVPVAGVILVERRELVATRRGGPQDGATQRPRAGSCQVPVTVRASVVATSTMGTPSSPRVANCRADTSMPRPGSAPTAGWPTTPTAAPSDQHWCRPAASSRMSRPRRPAARSRGTPAGVDQVARPPARRRPPRGGWPRRCPRR